MDIENLVEIEVDTSTESSLPTEMEKVGPPGLSAYEIAIKDGFVGTEEEWLASLKGDPGVTGATGQPGPQGLPGRDGYVQYTAGENITIENNVISAIGGGEQEVYYYKDNINNSNPFVFDGKKKGIYVINSGRNVHFWYKVTQNEPTKMMNFVSPLVFIFDRDVDYDEINDNFGCVIYYNGNNGTLIFGYAMVFEKINKSVLWSSNTMFTTILTSNQTISGAKTFSTIPKQSNTTAPTQDTEFTNKKYVDDSITTAIGNINTVLATLTTPQGGE